MNNAKPIMTLPAASSMSTRLALICIIVASILSFVISGMIIAADAWDEHVEIKERMDLVLETWDRAATEAAFQLDESLSAQIVNSIGMSPTVTQVNITSDLGDVLATWNRESHEIGFLESSIVGNAPIHRHHDLFIPERETPIGKLSITFSRGKLYEPVFSRAKRTLASAVSQSVLLALALWLVVNKLLAKPLRSFIEALAKVNIQAPTALGDRFSAKNMKTELGLLNRTADTILTSIAKLLKHKKQAGEKIMVSEQRFEAFAGAASDWFWETGPESELVYLSSQYEAATGFSCNSLIGQPFLQCAYPSTDETPPEAGKQLARALELRKPFRDIPTQIHSAEGIELFLCYSGVPQFSERDEFLGFRGTVRDATPENEWDKHRQFLTESLNHSEKLKVVGQLTAGVAHDFNNLLGAIQSNVELLSMGWGDSAEHRQEVVNAVKRGSLLTKRLLTYSRTQKLSPSSIEVEPLIHEVDNLLSRVIGEQIDFQCFSEEGVKNCYADRGQLESVLINLCINARDAMPSGGRLTLKAAPFTQHETANKSLPRGEYICFSVHDTGDGMDAHTLAMATEPFFTTKPVGTGTGLGLSMAVEFADRSQGSLLIESKPGEGTTIRLYLLEDKSVAPVESPAPSTTVTLPTGLRILVVEDDPAVQKAIEGHLKSMSCVTVCANDGPESLEIAAAAEGFDVLLIDMVLPGGLTGMQLAERLDELLPTAKKIFMSGYSKELAANAIPENGPAVLEKPFGRDQLIQRIYECIGQLVK